ncbi:hypothetical protein FS749_003856 [Ceratobasidium sp. UAMH 11750]|nr:hypothetical protein FS749_003856 [Ceratobasidium sp. UAMH 11750]
MPYPDPAMDARPALPVEHVNWIQERETLVIFFTFLWKWQGGPGEPAWPAIVADINSGAYLTIDRQRLPAEHHPFVDPRDWGEIVTRSYSRHLRLSHNDQGCALASAFATCFQFRRLFDEHGDPLFDEILFRTMMHPQSNMFWGVSPLLYGRRILPDKGNPMRDISHGAGHYAPVEGHVLLAKVHVKEVLELYLDVIQLDDADTPDAPEPDPVTLSKWHPAALHALMVVPNPANLAEGWDFGDQWRCRTADGHGCWSSANLREWVSSFPFPRGESGTLLTGQYGPGIAFLAILYYVLNVGPHMALTTEQRDAMIVQDLAVYGKAEMRDLMLAARSLMQNIRPHLVTQPSPGQQYPSDQVARASPWTPNQWLHVMTDGVRIDIPALCIQRPDWNLFAGTIGDDPFNIAISEHDLITQFLMEGTPAGNLQGSNAGPSTTTHEAAEQQPATTAAGGESSAISNTPHSNACYTPSLANTDSVTDEWQGTRV